MGEYRVVIVTASDKAEAQKITQIILEKKLAACVNTVNSIESRYWWQGKIEIATESLMIIKTTQNKFEQLQKVIKENHSYDTPEIIALPILEGNPNYLDWISQEVNTPLDKF